MTICPKCGAENGKRVKDPVKCCRCWYQFVRGGSNGAGHADAGATGGGKGGKAGGSGNDAAVPVLRGGKGAKKHLRAVPAGRGELAGLEGDMALSAVASHEAEKGVRPGHHVRCQCQTCVRSRAGAGEPMHAGYTRMVETACATCGAPVGHLKGCTLYRDLKEAANG